MARKLPAGIVGKLNLGADLALIAGALLLASRWSKVPAHSEGNVIWFAAIAMGVWVFTSFALRYYDPWISPFRERHDDAALATVLVMSIGTVLQLAHLLIPPDSALPSVGYFLLIFWPSVLVLRFAFFRPLVKQERPLDEVLVIGIGPLGMATGEDLARQGRRRVRGYLAFPNERGVPPPNTLLGESRQLETLLKTTPLDEVYIAGNALRQAEAMEQAVRTCERLGVPFALPAHIFRLHRARSKDPRAMADGYVHYLTNDSKPLQLAFKRLFDVLFSALAIWLLLPVFPVVAALIKLTSKGPILFRQRRAGLHGRPFNLLKFRSMVADAEDLRVKLEKYNEQSGPVFKIRQDPRLTWIGSILRRYSIDELPQLINVLRGEMSLVGPRPPIPEEVQKYKAWQCRRLSVRPGLTCIWQVSGRNEIPFEQWMYLDLQYIDHWSLSQDFNLILKTVPAVLTGRGAS